MGAFISEPGVSRAIPITNRVMTNLLSAIFCHPSPVQMIDRFDICNHKTMHYG